MRALRGLETARVLPGLRPVTLPPQLLSSQCSPGRWSCALTSAKATAKQQHLTTLGRALSQHRAVYTAHTWSPVLRGLHDYMSLASDDELLTTAAERPRIIFIAETKTGR